MVNSELRTKRSFVHHSLFTIHKVIIRLTKQDRRRTILSKERPETFDDGMDGIGHSLKCWNEHCMENVRFSEHYLEAEMHILMHFRVRGIPELFVAFFHRAFDHSSVQTDESNLIDD